MGCLCPEHGHQLGTPVPSGLDVQGDEGLLGGRCEGEGVPLEQGNPRAAEHDVLPCHGSETPGLAQLHLLTANEHKNFAYKLLAKCVQNMSRFAYCPGTRKTQRRHLYQMNDLPTVLV